MEYNHETEKNIEIQGNILVSLITPMSLKTLIKKMSLDYRTRKNDVLRNSNYLAVAKGAIIIRKGVLYLEKDAPARYVRKRERILA